MRINEPSSSPPSTSSIIPHLKRILFGQSIALSLACCSAASSTLQNMEGVKNMPLLQISAGYFFLGCIHLFKLKNEQVFEMDNDDNLNDIELRYDDNETTQLVNSKSNAFRYDTLRERAKLKDSDELWHPQLHSPWYFYALLAFLDVNANFSAVLSFKYTSLISSNILTSLSILSVMISSRIILSTRFTRRHFLGAFVCLIGASMIVSSDIFQGSNDQEVIKHTVDTSSIVNFHKDDRKQHKSSALGDIFAIVAAVLFGLNDTLAEYCIKSNSVSEYLGMLGTFGFICSFIESILFERGDVVTFCRRIFTRSENFIRDDVNVPAIFFVWTWYILCLFYFYTSASKFLSSGDATFLSLSLQTSNVWTILFSVIVQAIFPTPIFLIATCVIIIGVYLYESGSIF
jgi:drug/metabolite transporter (DMT)-like permease